MLPEVSLCPLVGNSVKMPELPIIFPGQCVMGSWPHSGGVGRSGWHSVLVSKQP